MREEKSKGAGTGIVIDRIGVRGRQTSTVTREREYLIVRILIVQDSQIKR